MGTVADGVWSVTIGGVVYQIPVIVPPGPPTGLTWVVIGTNCTLSWTPPASLGSVGERIQATSITTYTITVTHPDTIFPATHEYTQNTTFTITNLQGSNILVYLTATNNQNTTSSTSPQSTIQTNVPDAPTLSYQGVGSITWPTPSGNGSNIDGYIVEYNGNSITLGASATSFNPVTHSIPGGTNIYISAVNGAGVSASSSVIWLG
jgi:hypothetical protein